MNTGYKYLGLEKKEKCGAVLGGNMKSGFKWGETGIRSRPVNEPKDIRTKTGETETKLHK